MANHCFNSITVFGNHEELLELYGRLTFRKDYIDYWHLLNKERPKSITRNDLYEIAGTKWFTADIELLEDSITINGRSAWSPPITLFTNLVFQFPSIKVEMDYEEPMMDFGDKLEISIKGTNEIFRGTYRGYLAHTDYAGYLENAKWDMHYYIEYKQFITETEIKKHPMFESVKDTDWKQLLYDVAKESPLDLYEIGSKENPHIFERFFAPDKAEAISDIQKSNPNMTVAKI